MMIVAISDVTICTKGQRSAGIPGEEEDMEDRPRRTHDRTLGCHGSRSDVGEQACHLRCIGSLDLTPCCRLQANRGCRPFTNVAHQAIWATRREFESLGD
jgi:hypothetical protein